MTLEVAFQLVTMFLLTWMMFWLKGIRDSIRDLYRKYNSLSNDLFHEVANIRDRLGRIEGSLSTGKKG